MIPQHKTESCFPPNCAIGQNCWPTQQHRVVPVWQGFLWQQEFQGQPVNKRKCDFQRSDKNEFWNEVTNLFHRIWRSSSTFKLEYWYSNGILYPVRRRLIEHWWAKHSVRQTILTDFFRWSARRAEKKSIALKGHLQMFITKFVVLNKFITGCRCKAITVAEKMKPQFQAQPAKCAD